jgi:arsenate reductase
LHKLCAFAVKKLSENMLTLYGIPNCDTVKKARAWLDGRGVAYRFHDYKKAGISKEKLDAWLNQVPWERLVNRAGMTFRQLPEAQKPTDAASAVVAMLANPSLIRRPLIEADGKVLTLGFKAEEFEEKYR